MLVVVWHRNETPCWRTWLQCYQGSVQFASARFVFVTLTLGKLSQTLLIFEFGQVHFVVVVNVNLAGCLGWKERSAGGRKLVGCAFSQFAVGMS